MTVNNDHDNDYGGGLVSLTKACSNSFNLYCGGSNWLNLTNR